MDTNEKIIEDQLRAYNDRDIEKFVKTYAADIEIYNFQESKPFIRGIKQLKDVYSDVFETSPKLQASIRNRIIYDNKVIDEEEVTGRKGLGNIKVVVIYEITNHLISKVTFIKKD